MPKKDKQLCNLAKARAPPPCPRPFCSLPRPARLPLPILTPTPLEPPAPRLPAPQLLELALSARRLLTGGPRDKATRLVDSSLPAVHSDVLEKFLPLAADYILEALVRDEAEMSSVEVSADTPRLAPRFCPSPAHGAASEVSVPWSRGGRACFTTPFSALFRPQGAERANPKLVEHMQAQPLAQKVGLAFVVQALAKRDLASATPFLAAAAEALPDAVLAEEGAFLATLAQQLQPLVKGGKVAPCTPLWEVAFGSLLTRGCGYHLKTLDETLRLLSAAGGQMPAEELARAVEATLERSRHVRKRGSKRRAGQLEQLEYERGGRGGILGLGGYLSGGYTSGGGYASSGPAGGGGYSSASDGSMRSAPVGKARRAAPLSSSPQPPHPHTSSSRNPNPLHPTPPRPRPPHDPSRRRRCRTQRGSRTRRCWTRTPRS